MHRLHSITVTFSADQLLTLNTAPERRVSRTRYFPFRYLSRVSMTISNASGLPI